MIHRFIICICLSIITALSMMTAGCGKQDEPQKPKAESREKSPPPSSCYNERLKVLAAEAFDTVHAEEGFDGGKYARAEELAARLRTGKQARPGDESTESIIRELVNIGRPAVPALLAEFADMANVESRRYLLLPLARMPEGIDIFLPFVLEVLEYDRRKIVRRAVIETTQTLLLKSDDLASLAADLVPKLVAISMRTEKSDVSRAALSQVYEFQIRGCRLQPEITAMLKDCLKGAEYTETRAVLAARCLLEEGEDAGAEFLLKTLREALEITAYGDDSKRELALWVLHFFGEKRAVAAADAAIELLNDGKHPEVRQTAAWALGRLTDDREERILKALEGALQKEKDTAVFKETAETLAEIGDERAFRIIWEQFRENEADLLRLYSIDALSGALNAGELPAALAAEILTDFTSRAVNEQNPSIRLRCVSALGAASGLESENARDEIAAELVSIMNHDPQFWIRAEAAAALGRFSGPVTDLLDVLSGGGDEYVKLSVIKSLGERRSAAAIVPLVEAVKEGSRGIVTACAESLPKLEGFSPELLFEEYLSPGISQGAKKNILACLRDMEYEQQIASFLLDDALPVEKDAARRAQIVRDIGRKLKPDDSLTPKAVARFREILSQESDTEAMGALIETLGTFAAQEALEDIVQAARRNEQVIPHAVLALRLIGDPKAMDFFLEILSQVTFDNYQIYRAQTEVIAAALKAFDRAEVSRKIREVCADSEAKPLVRRAAYALTYFLDAPEIDDYLLQTAKNSDEPVAVRCGAVWGLAWRKCRRALPDLEEMLKSEEIEIARSAAFALGVIGDIEAFIPLLDMLKALRNEPAGKAPLKDMIIFSLEQLTGKKHGENIHAWEQWHKTHVHEKDNQEQD